MGGSLEGGSPTMLICRAAHGAGEDARPAKPTKGKVYPLKGARYSATITSGNRTSRRRLPVDPAALARWAWKPRTLGRAVRGMWGGRERAGGRMYTGGAPTGRGCRSRCP
eukprot:scaffold2926_cov399-Prasinococcus_capsulatus_cf.AAC.14